MLRSFLVITCISRRLVFIIYIFIYSTVWKNEHHNLRNNNILLLPLVKSKIIQIILYGSNNYDQAINKIILSVVIDFIIQSKRFNDHFIQL